jgi:phospholipid/cholesterol/gamma-HCH transport system substrate-binding protein
MKKARKKTKLLVGAFVAMAAAVLCGAVLLMSDNLSMFKTKTTYFARFQNTEGLHVGSPIKLGGVEIGLIDDIAVQVTEAKPDIRAKLILISPYEKLVHEDSEVRTETQGVLGDKFLVLDPGTSAKALKAGHEIRVRKATELSAVMAKSTDILESVNNVMARLDQATKGLPTDAEVHAMFADFAGSAKTLRLLVGDPERKKRLDAAIDSFSESAGRLASITRKVDAGEGTLGALVNDTQVYDDVRSLLGRANRSKAVRFVVREALKPAAEDDAKELPAH